MSNPINAGSGRIEALNVIASVGFPTKDLTGTIKNLVDRKDILLDFCKMMQDVTTHRDDGANYTLLNMMKFLVERPFRAEHIAKAVEVLAKCKQ